MSWKRSRPAAFACLMIAALLAGTVPPAAADDDTVSSANVQAQYVLMAYSAIEDKTVPLVRAIVAQPMEQCPDVALSDGTTMAMSRRANPNPAAFGVAVCEAVVEVTAGTTATIAGGAKLPLPNGSLTVAELAVVGDSGCKAPKQDCDKDWPFAAIASAAAASKPDLVVHVGDYDYSGTPSKTGAGEWSYDGCVPQDAATPLVRQSTYDTWTTWDHDFFTPAAPLLAAAPWVVIRGNHELCSRAGQGWFYFLDPHSPLLDPYQHQPGCDAPTQLTQPYLLSFANLGMVVYDTANACGGEDPESPAGIAYEVHQYLLQLTAVMALAEKSATDVWLVGHRPLWSVYQDADSGEVSVQNQTVEAALAATPAGALPSTIKFLLSGHMHQFFSLTFQQGKRPPQLVIGNSGVKLSHNALASPWSHTVDGVPATGLSGVAKTDYGYLEATVTDAGHWSGTVHAFDHHGTAQPNPLAKCALPISGTNLCTATGN